MAKKLGLTGCSGLRKDQLIRKLVRLPKVNGAQKTPKSTPASNGRKVARPNAKTASATTKKPATSRRLRRANSEREKQRDLSRKLPTPKANGNSKKIKGRKRTSLASQKVGKDRVVLLVRDAYWLQACWDVSRQSVERAKAALAEHWHTAKPTLRVVQVETGATTNTAERVVRTIEIHGGVKNWYIDIQDSAKSYRVDLGYSGTNRFYTLARSNTVTMPRPGSADAIDENWTDIADDYEKVFAQSGGLAEENQTSDLRDLFEERLRRPMSAPVVTRYGVGAETMLNRKTEFDFEVDAEMIIYGSTSPDAHVSLSSEPVKLRSDGSFTVRLSMPDRRQVIPVVARSADGVEQRTVVLAIERNTKLMEPRINDNSK
ncbi:MAG: DUF4912 domain-containing protein [Pirellulaceae bacterium]|nr:DUF4912 domain-containing protein [Pirellulaceae bacterium]